MRRVAPILVLAVALLGACSGAPADTTDTPAGTVRQAVSLIEAKDVEGLAELACAAQRETIEEQLLGGGVGGELLPGVDVQELLVAVEFDTSDVEVGEGTTSGDTAEVPMTGTLGVSFDGAKLRDVLRPILEQQDLPADDATLDLITSQASAFAQDVPLDQTLTLVREDGRWLICEEP